MLFTIARLKVNKGKRIFGRLNVGGIMADHVMVKYLSCTVSREDDNILREII